MRWRGVRWDGIEWGGAPRDRLGLGGSYQLSHDDMPERLWNLPTSQLEQVAAAAAEYSPPLQSVHALAPEPDDLPATHVTHSLALVFDHVPPSHLVHSLLPSSSEYLPLSHTMQAEARVLELVPALHVEQLTAVPWL